ncbi:hypothetical protein UPYG_G00049290, partial [Umbra pygmaea]
PPEYVFSHAQEPIWQEVRIERKTSSRQSAEIRNMSGMEALLCKDMDHQLEDRPKIIHDAKDTIVEEFNLQEVRKERKSSTRPDVEVKDVSGMEALLIQDLDQHREKRPVEDINILSEDQFHKEIPIMYSQALEQDNEQDGFEQRVTTQKSKSETHLALSTQSSEEDDQVHVAPKADLIKWDASEIKPSPCKTAELSYPNLNMQDSFPTDVSEASWASFETHESFSAYHKVVHSPDSVDLALRPAYLEAFYPETLEQPDRRLSYGDSLENSPVIEDCSSRKSPDSIEPSPTRDSPCPDSLDSSPTELGETTVQAARKSAMYEDYYSQLRACVGEEHVSTVDEGDWSKEDDTEGRFQPKRDEERGVGHEASPMPLKLSLPPNDNVEDAENMNLEDSDHGLKQFTPEEKMFLIAAKVKTFEEMELDAKTKRHVKTLDAFVLAESMDNEEFQTKDTEAKSTQFKIDTRLLQSVEHETDYENVCSSPDSATTKLDRSLHSEGYIPQSSPQHSQESLIHEHLERCSQSIEKKQFATKDVSEHISESTEQNVEIDVMPDMETQIEETVESQAGKSQSVKPELLCTEDESLKEVEDVDIKIAMLEKRPQDMSVQGDLVPWSAMHDDDDEAFHARVEAEEQRIMDLMEDRHVSDTTPIRTPTEEGTPSPFQFQEGKFFEMTRGGAIDMTRRSFEEQGYAFFHIGDHPVDEVLFEDTGNYAGPNVLKTEERFGINELHIQEEVDLTKDESDPSFQTIPLAEDIQGEKTLANTRSSVQTKTKAESVPFLQTEMGSSLEVQLGSPELQGHPTSNAVCHSVYSVQLCQLSDSSPEEEEEEEQSSVIEMRATTLESVVPPGGVQGEREISAITLAEEESSFKSKIPVKSGSLKSELGLDAISAVEESLDQERRTRSEADFKTGKQTLQDKNRSHSDGHCAATEPQPLPSRLPIRGKHTAHSTSHSSSSQPDQDQYSGIRGASLKSSLDFDDSSSSDHNSPDSVIFRYDSTIQPSLDLAARAFPRVRPTSVTEEVFESRPIWEDTVETQMQRISVVGSSDRQQVDWHDDTDRKEETLTIIADLLGFSWAELARELEFNEDEIQDVRTDNPNSLQEQSHALLQRWSEREGKHATEDSLIKRLTKINRMDIVHLIETQMNKTAQEQISRTYAEIEKTLDQSEVSVALSLVQEDADSPRLVRRVESSHRPPPAVSEEDLSVASLLDIPSWAEPMGHTHSESIHGDMLEDLEAMTELSPNLWSSQDVVTRDSAASEPADEMTDIPQQSVTEEQYTDDHGNAVVRKVTRKVIRRVVSPEGVQREQVEYEGGTPPGDVEVEKGDGYSRVVKRTVVRSHEDHSEVTFAEHVPDSECGEESAEGQEVSHMEQKTAVEGERTETLHGDHTLTSDLPTARDDFTQSPDV